MTTALGKDKEILEKALKLIKKKFSTVTYVRFLSAISMSQTKSSRGRRFETRIMLNLAARL